jgi:hypothetical protein
MCLLEKREQSNPDRSGQYENAERERNEVVAPGYAAVVVGGLWIRKRWHYGLSPVHFRYVYPPSPCSDRWSACSALRCEGSCEQQVSGGFRCSYSSAQCCRMANSDKARRRFCSRTRRFRELLEPPDFEGG